ADRDVPARTGRLGGDESANRHLTWSDFTLLVHVVDPVHTGKVGVDEAAGVGRELTNFTVGQVIRALVPEGVINWMGLPAGSIDTVPLSPPPSHWKRLAPRIGNATWTGRFECTRSKVE